MMFGAEQLTVKGTATSSTAAAAEDAAMPDYLLEPNAVLRDKCRWRQGHVRAVCTAGSTWILLRLNLGLSCAGSQLSARRCTGARLL